MDAFAQQQQQQQIQQQIHWQQQQIHRQQLERQQQQQTQRDMLRNQQWTTQSAYHYRGRGPVGVIVRLIMFVIVLAIFASVIYLIAQRIPSVPG